MLAVEKKVDGHGGASKFYGGATPKIDQISALEGGGLPPWPPQTNKQIAAWSGNETIGAWSGKKTLH